MPVESFLIFLNARLATVGDELFWETVFKQLPSVIAKICKQIMEPQSQSLD